MTDKPNNLIVVYEQYWLNSRQNENHRLWFTNIYVLIVAGVLALIGKGYDDSLTLGFSIFLLILSIIGLFTSYANCMAFVWYSRMCEKILYDLNLGKDYSHWFGINSIRHISKKRVGIGRLYIYFYTVMISVTTTLTTWKLVETLNFDIFWEYVIPLIIGCLSLLFTISIYFRYLRKDLKTIHDHFENIINKSKQKRTS